MSITGSLPCTSGEFARISADILRAGSGLRFRAHGASMHPLVRDGDILSVQPVDAATVRLGDVVLCGREADRIVVHRVIRVVGGRGERRFLVQGDAVPHPDGLIPAGDVYGRVAAIERGGATMNLDAPALRMLGIAGALRSRWHGGGFAGRLVGRAARRLPGLRRYLT